MDQEEFYSKVLRKLDVLIALQMEKPGLITTATEKIVRLSELGLNSTEIGQIVNKGANYVTAVTSKKGKRQ